MTYSEIKDYAKILLAIAGAFALIRYCCGIDPATEFIRHPDLKRKCVAAISDKCRVWKVDTMEKHDDCKIHLKACAIIWNDNKFYMDREVK